MPLRSPIWSQKKAKPNRRFFNPIFFPTLQTLLAPGGEAQEQPRALEGEMVTGWEPGHGQPAASSCLRQTNMTEMDFQKGPQMWFLTFSALWTNHCLWQASLLLEAWPEAEGGEGEVLLIISLEKHCTLTTQGSNCTSLFSDTLWKREKALESQVKRLILLKHPIQDNSLCWNKRSFVLSLWLVCKSWMGEIWVQDILQHFVLWFPGGNQG